MKYYRCIALPMLANMVTPHCFLDYLAQVKQPCLLIRNVISLVMMNMAGALTLFSISKAAVMQNVLICPESVNRSFGMPFDTLPLWKMWCLILKQKYLIMPIPV